MKTTHLIDRPKKKVRIRVPLNSLLDCRREAARLYRAALAHQMSQNRMSPDDARTLASVLRTIADFITTSELEVRLTKLEMEARHEI